MGELKEKMNTLSQKVAHSENDLEKQKVKLALVRQKRKDLNEFDIYELDSYFKNLQDFLNNAEISLYKLNNIQGELKAKGEHGFVLDLCELVLARKTEILLCLDRTERTERQWVAAPV